MRRWLAAAGVALACSGGDTVHDASGVVREVWPEEGQIKIEHSAIEGVMPAMTMSFDVADASQLAGLVPGVYVEFRLLERDGRYAILEIASPVGDEAAWAGEGGSAPADPLAEADDAAPDFALVDQDGRPLALADLRGEPVLLDFIFTRCPGPCPILTGLHADVLDSLAPAERARVHFVSVSLDPAHDTPDVLAGYARERRIDTQHWSFATGSLEEVQRVLSEYGVGTIRKPNGEIDHTVASFLIDAEGRIAKRYLGTDDEVDAIRDDIRELL